MTIVSKSRVPGRLGAALPLKLRGNENRRPSMELCSPIPFSPTPFSTWPCPAAAAGSVSGGTRAHHNPLPGRANYRPGRPDRRGEVGHPRAAAELVSDVLRLQTWGPLPRARLEDEHRASPFQLAGAFQCAEAAPGVGTSSAGMAA